MNTIWHGNCVDILPTLSEKSINLVVTSPPYANQRKKLYDSISEEEYPEFTCRWMNSLKTKLLPDASVFIIIRPNIKNGELSDYVLKTRLAIRSNGWIECEELIWFKNDAPPLGSPQRPRRTYEHILWYSLSGKPYMNLKACGQKSDKIGFVGSTRFGLGGDSPISSHQNKPRQGVSRSTDVLRANIGEITRGIMHPAMFPQSLANQLILTYSRESDLVIDPFVGSGTVCLSALSLDRKFFGCDTSKEYVEIAKERINLLNLAKLS